MQYSPTGIFLFVAVGFIIDVGFKVAFGLIVAVGFSVAFGFSVAVGFIIDVGFKVAFGLIVAVGFSRRLEALFLLWGFSPFSFGPGLKSL